MDFAAGSGRDGAVELLLAYGAQANGTNRSGLTPLHTAARLDHTKSVRLLLARIPVNTLDARGNTALHYAMERANVEMVTLLLTNGADLNTANHEGVTPLFYAINLTGPGRLEVMELLLNRQAAVNVTNVFGKTLFGAALERGNSNVIQLLLQHGAKELPGPFMFHARSAGRPRLRVLAASRGQTPIHGPQTPREPAAGDGCAPCAPALHGYARNCSARHFQFGSGRTLP